MTDERIQLTASDSTCPECGHNWRSALPEGHVVERRCPQCGTELSIYQPRDDELLARARRWLHRRSHEPPARLILDLLKRIEELTEKIDGWPPKA